ncbi:hypothetical protein ELS82_21620 [Vibrio ouci]|uniref:Uncharacterized protein n=1 Tax=Vibrio ouci TaxID=2499078 RepID=A0A4Y8W9N2_9VIBR|nr:hypothetical protein ELS82_21620 [Vibrio ouci]
MTSPLMKPTLVGRDTLHELDQPLKKLAYVSNHWGPLLLNILLNSLKAKLYTLAFVSFMESTSFGTDFNFVWLSK